MKIHRISLTNLGSLYGTHSVDLDNDLGGASLFLIHGPTGSGKSTLMDAVALALFGQTPRLQNDTATATDTPADNNARQLVSRGTADASATVVFSRLASDGRRFFEAKWSVRRASGKVDGRFQAPSRSLRELDADLRPIVNAQLTDSQQSKAYESQFSEALGTLKLVDFSRSVLLAQGEFSAFLRAKPEERAGILKRIADSSIYKSIGLRAHERWQRSKALFEALNSQVDQSTLPGEDELASLSETVSSLTAEQRLGSLAGERLEALAHIRRDLLGLLTSDAAATEQLFALRQRTGEVRGALETARTTLGDARVDLDRVVSEEDALAPLIADARLAATENAVAKAAVEAAEAACRDDALALAAADERLVDATRRRDEAARTATGLRESAGDAKAWSDASDRVDDVKRETSALRYKRIELGKLDAQLKEQRDLYARTDKALKAKRERRDALGAQLAPLQARVAEARVLLERTYSPYPDPSAAANARRAELRRLDAIIERYAPIAQLVSTRDQSALDHGEASTRLASALVDRQALTEQFGAAAARAEELRQNVALCLGAADLVRAAGKLLGHRRALVCGEKCPVCGSLDHPDAHLLDEAVLEQVARAETALAEATAHRDTAGAEAARLQLQLATATENERQTIAKERQEHARLEAAEGALEAARGSLAAMLLDADLAADTPLDALRARRSELDRLGAELARAIEGVGAAEEAIRSSSTEFDSLSGQVEGLEQSLVSMRDEGLGARKTFDDVSTEISTLAGEVAGSLLSLPTPLTPHEARFDTLHDIDAIDAWLGRQSQLAVERLNALERAERDGAAAARAHEAAAQLRGEQHGLVERRGAELLAAQAIHDEATRKVAAYFNGTPPDAIERASRERRDVAHKRSSDAIEAVLRAEADDRAIHEATERLTGEIESRGAQRSALEVQLRAGLVEASYGETTDVLADELGAWIAERREAISTRSDEISREIGNLQERLRAAREQQLKHGKLLEEVAAAQADAAFWNEMNSLIGARQGDVFADFAQALTLERLLQSANVHLRKLAPRYAFVVRRAADNFPTLVFEVRDHDQADTLRPLTTLSGGETFLCSLALALGLSDLHRLKLPIETLLLDEGFGTLDPETLDVAIGALEQLHANGARVGIISHVSELQQRIPARVAIHKLGNGRSQIVLPGGRLASDPR